MFTKVLVPLDGSRLAECALATVINMAREGSIGEVILLSIAEVKLPIADFAFSESGIAPGFDFQELRHTKLDKYHNYLGRVEAQLSSEGIKAETVVVENSTAAKYIADFAEEIDADLIVMATHGYTGMKKLFLGSVAAKVVNESRIPVLLIRPEATLHDRSTPRVYEAKSAGRSLHL